MTPTNRIAAYFATLPRPAQRGDWIKELYAEVQEQRRSKPAGARESLWEAAVRQAYEQHVLGEQQGDEE